MVTSTYADGVVFTLSATRVSRPRTFWTSIRASATRAKTQPLCKRTLRVGRDSDSDFRDRQRVQKVLKVNNKAVVQVRKLRGIAGVGETDELDELYG